MDDGNKSWWSRRTSLEKTLTVICGLGALLSIGLLVGLIVVAVSGDDDICLTNACIQESSMVLKNMNLEADPCDDFYEFACGNFLKETIIPDDKTQVTAFSVIDNKLKQDLRLIVQQPIGDNEVMPFQNVKRLYQACMNVDQIETLGKSLFAPLVAQWPVVSGPPPADWTWQKSVADSRNAGYSASYFFSFSVSTDNRDSLKRVIRIDQASLGLSRQYLIKGLAEPFVGYYNDYQRAIAMSLGANSADAVTQMLTLLNFEIELANISMAAEDRRDFDKLYNPMTVAEIQTKWSYPGMNWLEYFNSLLPTEAQLVSSDRIIVGAVSFFDQLGDLLSKTSNRVLANYAIWRRIAASVSYMPKEVREIQQVYVQKTTGREVQDPRWLECVNTALDYYPHAFGALYVRQHFKEEAKEKVLEMVKNIKDEFQIMLNEIDWMDADTKTKAKDKAEKMAEQMAYADELNEDSKLVEYYNTWPYTVNETKYFESIFALNKASTDRSWKRLREPIDKKEWSSFVTPAIVNAFYSSLENSIKFPAGILQGAFFNADRPKYMNYGGIGFVIGHEITHGFDDQGSQYDGDGNLVNWWAAATRTNYKERAQCIIDQYGNYTEPLTKLNLNGINTQGENIADNGGIKESYRAYVRWAKSNKEQKMPGLDFSPQQMFWISAGQIWCSLLREATLKNRIETGVHSPGQFRVIGPMSNMPEFANDFGCQAKDNMYSEKRCTVW